MKYIHLGYRHEGHIWIITAQYPKKNGTYIEIRRYEDKTPITDEVLLKPCNVIEVPR